MADDKDITIKVLLDTDDAKRAMSKLENNVEKTAKRAGGGFGRISKGLSTGLAAFGGAAIAAPFAPIIQATGGTVFRRSQQAIRNIPGVTDFLAERGKEAARRSSARATANELGLARAFAETPEQKEALQRVVDLKARLAGQRAEGAERLFGRFEEKETPVVEILESIRDILKQNVQVAGQFYGSGLKKKG